MKKYIVFDVGGTNIKYGVVSEAGKILKKDKIKTNPKGEVVITDICAIIEAAKEKDNVVGAAFSMPGFVNVETGKLQTAGALYDLYGMNLKEEIEKRTKIRVEVENDVNCVALAEKWLGNGVDNKNFLCVTIGTGIGGAIVIDDKLYRGKGFFAGEFGYMLTDPRLDKKNTNLSATGSVLSGIRKAYAESAGLDLDSVEGEDVFNKAKAGDELASSTINKFYRNLAIGLYNLIFIFNPEKILLGGAISSREELIDELKVNIREIIDTNETLAQVNLDEIVDIERCHFNNDSGLIGALYHYLSIPR